MSLLFGTATLVAVEESRYVSVSNMFAELIKMLSIAVSNGLFIVCDVCFAEDCPIASQSLLLC